MRVIEIRCPVGPRRLLMKVIDTGGQATIVQGNLIELACEDCKRTLRKSDPTVVRVLHRFNLAGVLIESEIVMPGD